MDRPKPAVVLATDSRDPVRHRRAHADARGRARARSSMSCSSFARRSGPGRLRRAAHGAAGARSRRDRSGDERGLPCWLAARAADAGPCPCRDRLGRPGAGVAAAARPASPVVRTEHLPYLLTDAEQRGEHHGRAAGSVDAFDRRVRSCGGELAAGDGAAAARRAVGDDPQRRRAPRATRVASEALRGARASADEPLLLMRGPVHAAEGPCARCSRPAAISLRAPGRRSGAAGRRGPDRDAREAQVAAARRSRTVRFLGARDDVADLLARPTCSCCRRCSRACRSSCSRRWRSGCPVVATRIGGTVEALGPEHPF